MPDPHTATRSAVPADEQARCACGRFAAVVSEGFSEGSSWDVTRECKRCKRTWTEGY